MHNNPYFNVFLDHVINLYKMIETCLKDDNMHIFLMINALICINNYVITCINSMLSMIRDLVDFQSRQRRHLTRLSCMVVECTRLSVKKKS